MVAANLSIRLTKYVQQEDRAMMFDTEMRAQLAVLLGGRAAEQFCCGHISTGAADDIQRATTMAYKVSFLLKLEMLINDQITSFRNGEQLNDVCVTLFVIQPLQPGPSTSKYTGLIFSEAYSTSIFHVTPERMNDGMQLG